ncbi:MAG TPA: CIA30 family protein [Rhodocyclaceae bacterium]
MTTTLIDFADPQEPKRWSSINDSVMGGLSSSRLHFDPAGHAVFSGVVSFENNGGFASVRRQPDDLAACGASAYLLAVRGDGKRYKLSLRTDDGFDGISYQCGFHPPAGIWTVCRLACGRFLPTRRGRVLVDEAALDPASVRQVGLLIGDRQEGEFSLTLRSIGVDSAQEPA